MKFIKSLLVKSVIAFIIVDGTIGITSYSEYASNFIPFLVSLLLLFVVFVLGISFVIYAVPEDISNETLAKLKMQYSKTPKWQRVINLIIHISLLVILAIHGFTISALLYLGFYVIALLCSKLNGMINDQLENMDIVLNANKSE